MRRSIGGLLSAVLLCGVAHAQTRVDIGYYNRTTGSFLTNAFTGAGGFVDTGRVDAGFLDATDAQGRSGNAIIVTPISDPVVRFNEYDMLNLTTDSFLSVTFHTPQYTLGAPFRSQLGFVDVSSPLGVRGRVRDEGDLLYEFSDFLGFYDGEETNFLGAPIYSTLHFYQQGGTPVLLDPSERGLFDFYVAYPATQGATSFYMDVVPSTTNGSNLPNSSGYRFSPLSNPGGGIVPAGGGGASAPEPGTLLLGGVGLLGLYLRRRR